MSQHALVVEDDAVGRLVLCHMLRRLGWTVDEAADAPEAIERVDVADYDLVISDYHLPSGNGIDVLSAVERGGSRSAFVLVTGIIEHSTLPPELTERLTAQLTKPIGSRALTEALVRLQPAADG